MHALAQRLFFAGLFSIGSSAPAIAQASCTVPAPSDHETHVIWGGETRQVFVQQHVDGVHIHTAEDGGRIRRSLNGGSTWTFAATPADATQGILDIWFNADGSAGYACGRGGRILKSTDGGATWNHLDPAHPVLLDPDGNPAALWRVRFLDANVGFVCGLDVFKVTTVGGHDPNANPWGDLQVFQDANCTIGIPLDELEFYCLDLVGTANGFAGAAGAEWEHEISPNVFEHRGLVFHTDTTVPVSQIGRKWWMTLDDSTTPNLPLSSMKEPWDLEFERGSTDLQQSVGYVVGGPGGNSPSRVYRSTDTGASWTYEIGMPVTMYGVAAVLGGQAMLCGYSGNVWRRNGANAWTVQPIPGPFTLGSSTDKVTAPLSGIQGLTTNDFVVTGAFGVQRRTTDYGVTYSYLNQNYSLTNPEYPWRLWGGTFVPGVPGKGFVCGQQQLIAKTTDGGCTWTRVQGGIGIIGFDSANLFDIEFKDSTRGIAVGDLQAPPNGGLAKLWYTANGGDNWSAGTVQNMVLPQDAFFVVAVSHASAGHWWAVGSKSVQGVVQPLVLWSRSNGSLWTQMTAPAVTGLGLGGVEFLNLNEGVVIGNTSSGPRAFRASFDGVSVVTWTEIPLTGWPSGKTVNALAMEGTTLALADGFIVGGGGTVQRWNGSVFEDSNTTATYNGETFELSLDLSSVAMAPNGPEVLIGAMNSNNESVNATRKGLLLRHNGTSWNLLRANAGYDIRKIDLIEQGRGYLIGGIHPTSSASFDLGKTADSGIFYYDAN